MKLSAHIFLISCLFAFGPVHAQTIGPLPPSSDARITSPEILYHISWLSSDSLEGRGTGTHANDVAAEYIAREFTRYGLAPAGENGTFFQTFDVVTGVETGASNSFTYSVNGKASPLVLKKDFLPSTFSKSMTVQGGVAFLSFGIKDSSWRDDYKDLPLKNCIAMILIGQPENAPSNARSGPPQISNRQKVMTARDAGAIAVSEEIKPAGTLVASDNGRDQ